MPTTTDNRVWSRDERGLIGIADDGRRDVRVTVTPVPGNGPPMTQPERHALLDELADVHNGLHAAQRRVLAQVRAASTSGQDWPTSRARLAQLSGVSISSIGAVLDGLERRGLIEQSDPDATGPRLVRLAGAREGANR